MRVFPRHYSHTTETAPRIVTCREETYPRGYIRSPNEQRKRTSAEVIHRGARPSSKGTPCWRATTGGHHSARSATTVSHPNTLRKDRYPQGCFRCSPLRLPGRRTAAEVAAAMTPRPGAPPASRGHEPARRGSSTAPTPGPPAGRRPATAAPPPGATGCQRAPTALDPLTVRLHGRRLLLDAGLLHAAAGDDALREQAEHPGDDRAEQAPQPSF